MNYRHIYHAGNFADVFKHVLLITLLESLQRKDTPGFFMDTHAGIGLYSLSALEAQKTREYERGIAQLMTFSPQNIVPPAIQHYLDTVMAYNPQGTLAYYPGSPKVAQQIVRVQDRLVLCELHSIDSETLKHHFPKHPQVAVHHLDGYLGLKAFLPPKERRGVVLIDPPFEDDEEWTSIRQGLQQALERWKQGIYAVWYPIKQSEGIVLSHPAIAQHGLPYIVVEFFLNESSDRLHACGIAVLNPPWQWKELLEESVLPYLSKALNARWTLESQA